MMSDTTVALIVILVFGMGITTGWWLCDAWRDFKEMRAEWRGNKNQDIETIQSVSDQELLDWLDKQSGANLFSPNPVYAKAKDSWTYYGASIDGTVSTKGTSVRECLANAMKKDSGGNNV